MKRVTTKDIVTIVAQEFGFPLDEITGIRRHKSSVPARCAVCWLAVKVTKNSPPRVAASLNITKATVRLRIKRVNDELIREPGFCRQLTAARNRIATLSKQLDNFTEKELRHDRRLYSTR